MVYCPVFDFRTDGVMRLKSLCNINSAKKIVRGSAAVFFFKSVGAFSLFCISVMISRTSGPQALGKFQMLSKIILITSVFSMLGLDTFSVRKIPEIGNNRTATVRFIAKSIKAIFWTSLVFVFLFLLFSEAFQEAFFSSVNMGKYIFFAALTVFFYSTYSFLCQVFRGFGSVKAYAFFRYSWINLFFLFFLAAVFLYTGGVKESFIFSGYFSVVIISAIVISVFTKFFISRRNFTASSLKKTETIFKMLRQSSPMMFSSSLGFIFSYSGIFIIGYFMSEYEVGIYSAISQFMLLYTYVSISIASYSAPNIAREYTEGNIRELKSIYLHSIIISVFVLVPILFILTIFPKQVLEMTFGEEYSSHYILMIILSVGFFLNALTGPTITTMNMTDRQGKLLVFSAVNSFVFIALCFLLTKHYGLVGTASAVSFSTGFFNIFLFGYIFFDMRRKRDEPHEVY